LHEELKGDRRITIAISLHHEQPFPRRFGDVRTYVDAHTA
jgi:hypothetical protein